MPGNAFYQQAGELHFKTGAPRGHFSHIAMCEGMIADLIPAFEDALNKRDILFCLDTHNEKSRRYFFSFKNIKYLRCPAGVGTVVKSEYQLMAGPRPGSIFCKLLDDEARRYLFVFLFSDQLLGSVHRDLYFAGMRRIYNIQHFSFSLVAYIIFNNRNSVEKIVIERVLCKRITAEVKRVKFP